MRKKFISTALAASVTVPNCAPWRVNSAKAASSENERIMMSRLSDSMRRKAAMSRMRWRGRRGAARNRLTTIARPSSMARNSPVTVAQATPATPQPSFRPSRMQSTMLMPFSTACSISPKPAFAAPEHVAEDGVVDQREGRGEQPDADIDAHRLADARFGAHEPLAGDGDQRRKGGKHDAGDNRDQHGAPEHRLFLQLVAAPESLGDEAGGAGAQEIEGGEDDIEDQRAGRQPAEQRRVAELADHRRIDDAEQRRRQIGERHRHGDGEHRAVGDDEGSGVGLGRTVQRIAALLIAA